jgi:predicted hydrolase (HD superfamily)
MDYSRERAIELLKKYRVSDEKILHCVNVGSIAKFIGEKFIENNVKINLELLYFSGLVHDIGDFGRDNDWSKDRHCELGSEILDKEGYTDAAKIVLKHNLLAYLSEELKPKTWEEKILNYSDKRERHGLVSLNERERRFLDKFPCEKEKIILSFKALRIIENEISGVIKVSPSKFNLFIHIENKF